MGKVLVFGHQNPDTDAITAAISYAYLQNELGVNAEAVALGKPTAETQYALDYFKAEAPRVITTAGQETKEVMLVDHNEFQQSVEDIEELSVLAVVDHHRVANFHTADPLYYRAEPVGCTNTIILKLFKESEIKVPSNIAGLMLSAIISDSLLFKSPTCTDQDVKAAKELADIAGVDLHEYGLNLLKAGTDTDSKSAAELLEADAKTFNMAGKNIRIGQVNVVDVQDVLKRKADVLKAMNAKKELDGYDLVLLVVTNILESESVGIIVGSDTHAVEKAFNQSVDENLIQLPGVVSRKKQVVPQLTKVFEK